jgi:hypothetical protein
MLLVDRLIHRWHWETAEQPPSFGLGRPTGVNLIEGNRRQAIELLDSLTYGAHVPPETAEARAAWRASRDEVVAKTKAWRSRRKDGGIVTPPPGGDA